MWFCLVEKMQSTPEDITSSRAELLNILGTFHEKHEFGPSPIQLERILVNGALPEPKRRKLLDSAQRCGGQKVFTDAGGSVQGGSTNPVQEDKVVESGDPVKEDSRDFMAQLLDLIRQYHRLAKGQQYVVEQGFLDRTAVINKELKAVHQQVSNLAAHQRVCAICWIVYPGAQAHSGLLETWYTVSKQKMCAYCSIVTNRSLEAANATAERRLHQMQQSLDLRAWTEMTEARRHVLPSVAETCEENG